MAKPRNLEAWGRNKARERYAEGGDVPPINPLDPQFYLDKLRKAQEAAGAKSPGQFGVTKITIGGKTATSKDK